MSIDFLTLHSQKIPLRLVKEKVHFSDQISMKGDRGRTRMGLHAWALLTTSAKISALGDLTVELLRRVLECQRNPVIVPWK
jgi:hypothetical protein